MDTSGTGAPAGRVGIIALALAMCLGSTVGPADSATSAAGPRPTATAPNFLLIVTDDQAWPATFSPEYNPTVYAELVDKGVLFDRAYDATSECCPSRSEILTGLNENHTGVDTNTIPLSRPTVVQALHDRGYRTMLSGKYLNSWPCTPRREFDQWICSYGYDGLVNPTLNVNGRKVAFQGYTSQIEANFVTQFIQSTPETQPFFVMYTPKDPHLPADDPRYESMTVTPYRPPSYDQETRNGKMPQYMQGAPLTQATKDRFDSHHADMARSVRAMDDDIGTILASLGSREQDTMVIYISDNGYLYGEHRRDEKIVPYEEAVRVPMIVRYPALVPEDQPFASEALVQNLDIAPTIAELVGFHWGADGLSIVPLLTGQATEIRTGAFMQHCEGVSFPCYSSKIVPSYQEVVTDQYAYIEYVTNERELYDLSVDPYEVDNVAGDASYATTEADLAGQLESLRAPPPTDTTIVTGPSGPQTTRSFSFTYFSQSRLATYECRLDENGTTGTWLPCDQQPHPVGPLPDGTYTFNVRGTDELGVTDDTPDTRTFTIARTGPDVQITAAPPADGHSGDVSFQFTGDPSITSYSCRLMIFGTQAGVPFTPCSSGVSYSGLGDALWSFEVYGQNEQGIRTVPPAQWLFRVDNAGPAFILTETPTDPTGDRIATFEFYPDEDTTGAYSCTLDANPPVDCSSGTIAYTDLGEGRHLFRVGATDLLGDEGETAFSWTVDLTPPTVGIATGPPPTWNRTFARFQLTGQGLQGWLCTLDDRPQIACPGSTAFFGLEAGAHVLTVSSFDRAGNVSAPVTWQWTQATRDAGPRASGRS